MFSTDEWSELYKLSEFELREFLADNSIEDIGAPPDWEEFYSYLTGVTPFKIHAGEWTKIFKNWYRPDIAESRGVVFIAAGCSNSDKDLEFFTKTAIFDKLWHSDDLISFIFKKMETVAKAKKNGDTPSVRFLRAISSTRHIWGADFINKFTPANVAAACHFTVKNYIPIDLTIKGCLHHWCDLTQQNRFTLLSTSNSLSSICATADREDITVLPSDVFLTTIQSLDNGKYDFYHHDFEYFQKYSRPLGSKNKRIIMKHIHSNQMDTDLYLKITDLLCSNTDMIKMNIEHKYAILKAAFIEASKEHVDLEVNAACERIFKLFGYSLSAGKLLAGMDETLVDAGIRAHLAGNMSENAPTIEF